MNSEMNTSGMGGSEAIANPGGIGLPEVNSDQVTLGQVSLHQALDHVASEQTTLDRELMQAIRHCLHELANVFTGVMIAGDLLSLHLAQSPLEHYATEILHRQRARLHSGAGDPPPVAGRLRRS
jgi:hypothetical protein